MLWFLGRSAVFGGPLAPRAAALFAVAGVLAAAISAPRSVSAQEGVCANPGGFCARTVDAACLDRVGAGAIPAGEMADDDACRAQLVTYRDCLALIAAQCPGAGPPEPETPAAPAPGGPSALEIWAEIKDVEDADVLEAFAASYPDSPLAVLARKRAEALRAASAAGAPPPPAPGPSPEEEAAAALEAAAQAARVAQVREAQAHLNRVGYPVGAVDGAWGPRSETALESFLRASGHSPARTLTPAALALLRAAPDAPAASPPPAPSEPAARPRPELKIMATFLLEIRFNSGRRERCRAEVETPSAALSFSRLPIDCARETYLRIKTTADGQAEVAVLLHGADTVRLNGSRWRYSGRTQYRGDNEIRSAVVSVDLERSAR